MSTALAAVNDVPAAAAAERLGACNASRAWVAAMLAGRPYPDDESLLALGEHTARALPWAEVRQALDAHPRIGDRVDASTQEAAWSRDEQAAVSSGDHVALTTLREHNAAYERRFGHVFLIRAAGRSTEQILGELRRRLAADEDRERDEVRDQLAQITRLRLERMLRP